jgi:predicted anti-sigma-YlaC factor YlaD
MSTFFLRHPAETDLALFAGGELGPVARWRIEGHLGGCARCRQAVSEFFELRSQVMNLAELPPLDWAGLAAGIQRRLESRRQRPWAPVVWRPAWGAALALFALVVAGTYLSYRYRAPGLAQAGVVSLGATADSVELRVGDHQVLTLLNLPQKETQVNRRVSADAVSARYLDADTGNITINNVYAE